MTATHIDTHASGHQRSIGPLGTVARVLVGGLLVAGQWLRARRTPTPLRATGPVALFWPIDQLEHYRTTRRAEPAVGSRPPKRTRR
jgi:hypothetical protein